MRCCNIVDFTIWLWAFIDFYRDRKLQQHQLIRLKLSHLLVKTKETISGNIFYGIEFFISKFVITIKKWFRYIWLFNQGWECMSRETWCSWCLQFVCHNCIMKSHYIKQYRNTRFEYISKRSPSLISVAHILKWWNLKLCFT